MVTLRLRDGRKGPGDIIVEVTSHGEILSFAEVLFILKCYFESEASYYPVASGFLGPAKLLNAINEISHRVNFDLVLKRHNLSSNLDVIDERRGRNGITSVAEAPQ